MYKDAKGQMIHGGMLVKIISPELSWFNYLSHENYLLLQETCRFPLKVDYLDDDGSVTLILPATLESDGDYVSNSLNLQATDVLVVDDSE